MVNKEDNNGKSGNFQYLKESQSELCLIEKPSSIRRIRFEFITDDYRALRCASTGPS